MFPQFCYQPRFLDDLTVVANNIHETLQNSVRALRGLETGRRSAQGQASRRVEQEKIRGLERFTRMAHEDFLQAHRQLKSAEARAIKART